LTPPLSNPQNDVQFWDSGWVSLQPGYGTNTTRFGPELSFGRAMADALPNDEIYLVKYARSGAGLADPTDWNPATGSDYSTFLSRVDAALDNLDNAAIDYEISGMLWMQGEHDTLNSADAAAYEANLTNFIATVRGEFETPNMPFIIGRITTEFGTAVNNALVRDAQVTVANNVGGAYWVDTDSLQLGSVGHYGTQGQIDLGELFAGKNLAAIPEPQSCTLLILTTLGLVVTRRRRKSRRP